MVKTIARPVAWALALSVILTCVFCLVLGLQTHDVSTEPYRSMDSATAWNAGWRTDDGNILTFPCTVGDGAADVAVTKQLPDMLERDAVLLLSSSYLPVRAKVNGMTLDVGGTFIEGMFGITYANAVSLVYLPADAAGKTLELTLCTNGSKARMEVHAARLGSLEAINALYIRRDEYTNILGLTLAAASVLLMTLGLANAALRIRIAGDMLFLTSSLLFCTAIWILTDCGVNAIRFSDNGAYLFLNLFGYILIGLPFELLVRKLCTVGRSWMLGLCVLIAVQPLVTIGLIFFGVFDLSLTLSISHGVYALLLVSSVVCVGLECVRGRKLRWVGVCMTMLMLSGGATMYNFYFTGSPDNTSYFRYGVVLLSVLMVIWSLQRAVAYIADTQSVAQLRYAANHDALTGLFTKSAFCERVAERLRKRPKEEYALCSFDFEHFKLINDLFGREQGDKLLCYTADCLREHLNGRGVYGRLESDKFLMFISHSDIEANRLCQGLQEDIARYPLDFSMTLSFGWYQLGDSELSPDAMVDRAGLARVSVKGLYLRRVAWYDETFRDKALYEQFIVNQISAALAEGQFRTYLQFKYNLSTGVINGAEALVRWLHPQRGMLSPGQFIPVLEKNGLILKLDEFIWRSACRVLRGWIDVLGEDKVVPISVNVSRQNLYNPNLMALLDGIVREYGVPPRLLELEITEGACSENPAMLIKIVENMHHGGFFVDMDDFGSGYSSLNMLKDVPVDVIKIDMKFLYGVESSKRSKGILTAVVNMARAMDIYMIAEGVETEAQCDLLREIGCLGGQGYLFSHPMAERDATGILLKTFQEREDTTE